MHAKCAGLTGRECDKIIAVSKKECGAVKWSCPVCIDKQIDFSKMYNSVRNQFSKLNKMAKLLSSDFDSSLELLSQYNFNSPPDCQFLAVPPNIPVTQPPVTPLASRHNKDTSPTLSLSASPGIDNLFNSPIPSAGDSTNQTTESAQVIVSSVRAGSGRKGRPPRTAAPNNRTDNLAAPTPEPPILNVVAPRKQVFVSRLS